MLINFQENDLSLESQWRAIILFGKNSATYKFAFGKALLQLLDTGQTTCHLKDLSPYYVTSILTHLDQYDKQGTSDSSTFLKACRDFKNDVISYDKLISITENYGFVNVVDAFQNVNGGSIAKRFYHKDGKSIILTDEIYKLKESPQYNNLDSELEARWNLVETAWNLNINPAMLEVRIDENLQTLYIESDLMRRIDITSARASLNGYQKGKCFYSFKNISIVSNDTDLGAVDHFFPHTQKRQFGELGSNINGIWNLVLANRLENIQKGAKTPELKYVERLYKRNEFYIASKHPLGETIVNQTGATPEKRRKFLQQQYDTSLRLSQQKWKPTIELPALF